MQTAVFGGGCFWCVEAIMKRLKGVEQVVSGYAGGITSNPSYYRVSEGQTGHAEVVQVTFDPSMISYQQLVEVFFLTHNPTTLNQQGHDQGTQYRSIILYEDEEQRQTAESVKAGIEKQHIYDQPIVTEIKKLEAFYPAESYHQDYYDRNSNEPYCQVIINPKVAKLREKFAPLLKTAGGA